jgi:hypothetical protein
MNPFVNAVSAGSDDMWAWFAASREIIAAMRALDETGAALIALADESEWHSDGVQALNSVLERFQHRTRSEVGDLRMRQWELERAAAA